jgi:hypothetical protein
MTIRKTIKKATKIILPYLFGGLLINQAIPALGFSVAPTLHANRTRAIVTNESTLNSFQGLPQNYTTLDYLNLASSIIYNFSEGKGDCKDFTKSTYDICISLIEQNNREDLRNNLRMVVGLDSPSEPGHQGIEYKNGESESYTFFETRAHTPVLTLSEVKDYSTITKGMKSRGIEKIMARSVKGKRIFYPTLDSLLIPGGLVAMCHSVLLNHEEISSSDTEVSSQN